MFCKTIEDSGKSGNVLGTAFNGLLTTKPTNRGISISEIPDEEKAVELKNKSVCLANLSGLFGLPFGGLELSFEKTFRECTAE